MRDPFGIWPLQEAVMYIPNHCSYLDIFTLSGVWFLSSFLSLAPVCTRGGGRSWQRCSNQSVSG